mgnify:CR=1 FL=1
MNLKNSIKADIFISVIYNFSLKKSEKILMKEFIKILPKIELHAHISGCMRKSTFIDFFKS